MNYTDEQFAALAPFEDNFRTAIGGEWTRRIRTADQLRIKEIYEAATKSRIPFNQGCGTCLLNLLRRAGRLFFQDKDERVANLAEPLKGAVEAAGRLYFADKTEREVATKPETPENTPKTPQISPSRAKRGNGTKTSNKVRKSAKK